MFNRYVSAWKKKGKFQKIKIKYKNCWCALKVQMLINLQHQLGQKVEGQAQGAAVNF